MPAMRELFDQAAIDVKTLRDRPDTVTMLKLYALYKQGSQGDIGIARPQGFDPVGNAKFNAWTEMKGMPPEEAQRQYVALVRSLLDR